MPAAEGFYSLGILPCATERPTKESRHPGQRLNTKGEYVYIYIYTYIPTYLEYQHTSMPTTCLHA